MDNSKESFLQYVSSLPTGQLEKADTLISFLKPIWGSLSGSSNQSTTASKLDRMEGISWEPPLLEFILERHGGTVNGSSVNINNWSAAIYKEGHRQLSPTSPRYNATNDAKAIAQLLLQGQYLDPRLEIKLDGRIKVIIAKIVPDDGAKSTTTARRKRFRSQLSDQLTPHGWVEEKANFWQPPKPTSL